MPFLIPAPQPIEYVQWTGDNLSEVQAFVDEYVTLTDNLDGTLTINSFPTVPSMSYIASQGQAIFAQDVSAYQELSTSGPWEYVVE